MRLLGKQKADNKIVTELKTLIEDKYLNVKRFDIQNKQTEYSFE